MKKKFYSSNRAILQDVEQEQGARGEDEEQEGSEVDTRIFTLFDTNFLSIFFDALLIKISPIYLRIFSVGQFYIVGLV